MAGKQEGVGEVNKGIRLSGQARINATVVQVGDYASASAAPPSHEGAGLEDLLSELRTSLTQLPAGLEDHRRLLEARTDELEAQSQKDEPVRSLLAVSANGLVETAKTVADVAPGILTVAAAIAKLFAGA